MAECATSKRPSWSWTTSSTSSSVKPCTSAGYSSRPPPICLSCCPSCCPSISERSGHAISTCLTVPRYWQVPYYWAGCKLYDVLAGGENMESSYVMSRGKALEAFPMLKGDGLVGAVVYYDGAVSDDHPRRVLKQHSRSTQRLPDEHRVDHDRRSARRRRREPRGSDGVA